MNLTAERLREVLSYDPQTGNFVWLVQLNGRVPKGSKAGTIFEQQKNKTAYWRIKVDRKIYGAHRLAWLYVYEEWPEGQIDHIDGNGLNNAIANLRVVSQSQNQWNRPATRRNKTGFKGVCWLPNLKKYQATIRVHGVQNYLGVFDDPVEAHAAYVEAAKRLHGEFARQT